MLSEIVQFADAAFKTALKYFTHKSSMTVSSEILNDDDIYKTLMCSELPNMTTLRVDCKTELLYPARLKTFTTQFGDKIERFHWVCCETEIDAADFRDMLVSMVVLKELNVYNVKARNEALTKLLNLPNLTSLSSYCNDSNIQNIILKIKSKNLKRFTMFSKDCYCSFNVNRFLRRNKNLRKLSLYGSFTNLYALRHLTSLQSLHIEECMDNNNTFNAICNLQNLFFLDISIENVSSCVVANLKKLNNLKKLVLRSDSSEHFQQLATINIPNLNSIQLNMGNISTGEETLEKFGSNYHQLENFEITFTENRNVYDFLENLKSLKNLSVNFEFEKTSCDSLSNYFAGMQNQIDGTKLKALSLNFINLNQKLGESNDNVLLTIVNFLPRLKVLSIQGIDFSFNEVFLENLLNVWHKIKELDLSFISKDCKEYKAEFTLLNALCGLLKEFSLNLQIFVKCTENFEKFKTDFIELEKRKTTKVSLSFEENYFNIKLDKS